MPRVSQAHLDARRQQILDAARARFASHGFAHTSTADLVIASGLSIGGIYRYFTSKDEIVTAICEQSSDVPLTELTPEAVHGYFEHVRALARDHDHARLVAQIYAEAAVSPQLAAIVERQLTRLRAHIADLLDDRPDQEATTIAEAFVAIGVGYSQQLAVRGDLDPSPFTSAVISILRDGRGR